jgi:RND family efflux transporter MFP subunit
MSKRSLAIVIALVVLGGMAAAIAARKRAIARMPPPPEAAIPVRTAFARDGQAGGTLSTVALVEATTSATVAAQVPGTILDVKVQEGDAVRKGQTLATIDARTLEDAVQAAEARLEAARQDLAKQQAVFNRDQTLVKAGAISHQTFELSQAQLAAVKAGAVSAERAMASVKTQRSFAFVPAPYTGVITQKLVNPGDLATPGKPLFAMEVPGPVKLISKLSQDSLATLTAGQEVVFRSGTQALTLKTSLIHPALDLAHLGTVETDLKAAPFGLPAGATLQAEYRTKPVQGVVVPASALLEGLDRTLVVKVVDGKAAPVPVTVLLRGESMAAVTGISAGDQVVLGLPSELMALTAGTRLQPVGGAR